MSAAGAMIDARAQAADFDPARQLRRLEELGSPSIASFTVLVDGAELAAAEIEHHPALTRNELGRIAAEAAARWQLAGLILIHRHGRLEPGERLAFAAVAAPEPGWALEACGFLVAALRTRAPFWRKDLLVDGSARWRRAR